MLSGARSSDCIEVMTHRRLPPMSTNVPIRNVINETEPLLSCTAFSPICKFTSWANVRYIHVMALCRQSVHHVVIPLSSRPQFTELSVSAFQECYIKTLADEQASET